MTWPWDPDLNSAEFRLNEPVHSPHHRHQLEKAKLLAAWNTVVIGESSGLIVSVAGSIRTASGRIRDFYLTVPSNYPYGAPKAFAHGWTLSGPHRWGDSEMCLWQRNQWQKNHTLAYAVAKTFTWIHKHEEYLSTGTWRGNEQRHS
ncbi:hypothetical protein [Amycolatopsis sp. NPDC004169]|uniref:hypothetical protein n=1 Tax=Amycolatopsis sp. NPDC004169 TaxID=3154453 RepID=UPI0033B898DB